MATSKRKQSPYPLGFSQRLRVFMTEAGLSAYGLAEKADLTAPAIYAWLGEKGKEPPKRENVEAVARALGRTYEELWGAPLSDRERTRLVQLEGMAARIRELLDEVEAAEEAREAREGVTERAGESERRREERA